MKTLDTNSQLIYPTVDLFLYDLAEGLGETPEKIEKNRQLFWQKVYGDSIDATKFKQLTQIETEQNGDLIFLFKNPSYQTFSEPDDGYYYPLKIGDTYSLRVDCSYTSQSGQSSNDFQPESLDCLKKIRQIIEAKIHQKLPTIGKSWLITGQMVSGTQDPKILAEKCYKAFQNDALNWQPDFAEIEPIKFDNITCFDLWHPISDWQTVHDNFHVLIVIFPPYPNLEFLTENLQKLYPQLNYLFLYRNKIIWAYQQSRRLKIDLKAASTKIQEIVKRLPDLTLSDHLN